MVYILAVCLDGSRSRTRTCDMVVNSHPLYRLSYPGMMVILCVLLLCSGG